MRIRKEGYRLSGRARIFVSHGGYSGKQSLVSVRWKGQMKKTGDGCARSRMKCSRISDD